jgi:hypothetical protein
MEQQLYKCCKIMIALLESLFAQKKITLDEYEREARLKRKFIDEYKKEYDTTTPINL